jgi:hypothetical protein
MTQVMMRSKHAMVLAAILVFFAGSAWTQENNAIQSPSAHAGSSEVNDSNAANNPLESLLTIDLQSRLVPSPEGFSGGLGNDGLLRVAVPIDTLGLHQFVRTILPINTAAGVQDGPNTGVGDLEVYDILPFQVRGTTLGAGPLVSAPTASRDTYGSRRWQAGAAGAAISLHRWGLLAVLATYQRSVSGSSSSPAGGLTTAQPFFFYHVPRGFYFRSSAIWTFDTFHHSQEIPVGFGFGKVWKGPTGDIVNLYIEPQYSVFHSGIGSPTWQIFVGATFKFPMRNGKKERF